VSLLAEGIIDGKVVVTEKKMPSRRSTKIRLYADEMGKQLVADGSDFIVVVAEITDDNGNVRRLAKDQIVFTVEGEGRIIGDASIAANPRAVEWGSAPVLIQSTNKAGKITIIARSQWPGTYAPAADTLTIESIPYEGRQCYKEVPAKNSNISGNPRLSESSSQPTMTEEEKRRTLLEVEQQQKDFGVK
jgi:beta-galactosidase